MIGLPERRIKQRSDSFVTVSWSEGGVGVGWGWGAYVTSVTYSEFPPTTHSPPSTIISFSVTYVLGNILFPTGTGTSRSLCVGTET